jgi:hypothetical protein
MTDKPEYSIEILRRYREADNAGSFMRDIVERVLVDPEDDELTLACGHKRRALASLVDAGGGKTFRCRQCADQWLAEAVREKRGGR